MARKPPKGKSLAELNPELSKQWHPTKNGDLTPLEIFLKSNKPFWWKCNKGNDHEWESSPSNRNKGSGCPVCSGHKAVKSNCLATTHPDLAKEWHPTMNGDLTPYYVTSGSHKPVFWKCIKGDDHVWQAPVARRKNSGCPICAGKKVVKSTCLATTHPEIAKQWHPTLNGKLTPNDVLIGYTKKVWWKCAKGDDHVWDAAPEHRSRGQGCSVCSGKKVVKSNCLATTNPEIAKKWHPTMNGDLTPRHILRYSGRRVWWKCNRADDHVFESSVANMESYTCPMCTGDIIVNSNCLATTHPEIAKQWHPTLNYPITPKDTSKGRTDKYWWKCDNGDDHIWDASPNLRTRSKGCPMCAGKRVVKSNSLSTLFPEIAKQWHPTLNGKMNPNNITSGSGRLVWWKCEGGEDHEWEATVSHRTNGTECPFCCNQKINTQNCLATLNPKLAKEWHSTKNGKLTPFHVGQGSTVNVWWQCDKNKNHEWNASIVTRTLGTGCPSCAIYGFDRKKPSLFYFREVNLINKKALKFGITNNLKGDREKQQSRHVKGDVITIFKVKVDGETALDIERLCKKFFGRKGFLTKYEFPDGHTETVEYSEQNLKKIKSIVDKVLTEKVE